MTEITEKQKGFLVKRNAYREGMTKEEAHQLIGELMGNKDHSQPIPERTIVPQEGNYERNGVPQSLPSVAHSHSPKDASIVAQCLTKEVEARIRNLNDNDFDTYNVEAIRQEVLDNYKWFFGELGQ